MKKRILLTFLLLLSGSIALFAQKKITGKVFDEQNQPLIGATILIKGTNQGTVTDVEGKYTIDASDGSAVLVISFIGYLTEEFVIGDQSKINVILVPDVTGLDEVVVIGYGTVRRRDLTAPVSSVSFEQLKDMPLTSTTQALTGRLSGVQITTSEGSPDAEVRIRVRGGGSITQDNSPLYIVDGFPVDGISEIAPSDIESIDVLKDASATAIYGARGANGVIIVTTKGGEKGKLRVTYNTYYGKKELVKKLDILDPYEYVLYQYERAQGSFPERSRFENIYGTWDQLDSLYANAEGTKWQKEVFGRDARTVSHKFGIAGGTEKFNYNLSYNYNNDEGIMIGSGYTRNSLNFKFQTQASKRITLDFNARYIDLRVLGAGISDPGKASQNRLRHSVMYRPVDGLTDFSDEAELIFTDDEYYTVSGLSNPVELTQDEYRNRQKITSSLNAALKYDIIDGLFFRTEVGYYDWKENDDRFYGTTTYLARRYADLPVVQVAKDTRARFRWANTLNYNLQLSKHDLTFLLGQEMINTHEKEFEQEIQEFPENISPEFALGFLTLGNAPQNPYSYISEDKLLSYFGRVNYNFNDKYLAQASLRADGSSKFFKGNSWGYFPSASAAWRISEESFMENINLISSLKLRVSYGQAGNNRIDNLYFLSRFETDPSKPYFLNELPISYLYRPVPYNPDLKWETTITRDVGLDLGIVKDRLNITLDYYYNTTRDLLVEVALDPSVGYENQIQNIGSTTNYGFEAAFNAYLIDKKDFKLSINFNIAFNRNHVDKLSENVGEMLVTSGWNDNTGADYIIRVGDPVGLMYGFETDGYYTVEDFQIDPETGEFLLEDEDYILQEGVADNRGILFEGFGPGSYRFRNLTDPVDSLGNAYSDGNLVTFEDDRTVIGNANPKHIGGINISAMYKGIDLSIFLNWVYGNDIYNANKIEFSSGYKPYNNLLQNMNFENRWITVDEEGEVVTDPEVLAEMNQDASIWKPTTGRYLFHSWAVEDGSFLRVNNITLGYTLPKKWMNKVFIDNLRFYFTVNNLYTFTRYSGYDPEVDTRRDTPMTPGVDYSAYPRSRMYLVGLNLTL